MDKRHPGGFFGGSRPTLPPRSLPSLTKIKSHNPRKIKYDKINMLILFKKNLYVKLILFIYFCERRLRIRKFTNTIKRGSIEIKSTTSFSFLGSPLLKVHRFTKALKLKKMVNYINDFSSIFSFFLF